MTYHKVVREKVVSPDGKVIAEASSSVVTSDNNQTEIAQRVSVRVTQGNSSSIYSSSSSSSVSSFHGRAN